MSNKNSCKSNFYWNFINREFTSSGNATLGDDSADSLTVNAAATFAASTTFSNSVILNQGATVTGHFIYF